MYAILMREIIIESFCAYGWLGNSSALSWRLVKFHCALVQHWNLHYHLIGHLFTQQLIKDRVQMGAMASPELTEPRDHLAQEQGVKPKCTRIGIIILETQTLLAKQTNTINPQQQKKTATAGRLSRKTISLVWNYFQLFDNKNGSKNQTAHFNVRCTMCDNAQSHKMSC